MFNKILTAIQTIKDDMGTYFREINIEFTEARIDKRYWMIW